MDLIEEIKKKINDKIKPDEITLINNSHLHSKHKSFDAKKIHLKIIIKSNKLKEMNKVTAHKEIFSILKDEMKTKINALEIEIQ